MTTDKTITESFYRELDTSRLIDQVEGSPSGLPEDRFTAVWVSPEDSALADPIIKAEAFLFPEIPKIVSKYLGRCSLLGILDPRERNQPLVYAARFSHYTPCEGGVEPYPGWATGLPLVDDIIANNPGYSEDKFRVFCRERNINPNLSIFSETLFRIKSVGELQGFKPSDIGYFATLESILTKDIIRNQVQNGLPAVFAHFNDASRASVARIGAEIENLGYGLRTPTLGGGYDNEYTPSVMPPSRRNLEYFDNINTALGELGLMPNIVDLRLSSNTHTSSEAA